MTKCWQISLRPTKTVWKKIQKILRPLFSQLSALWRSSGTRRGNLHQTSIPATAETIEGFQGLRLNFSEAGDGRDWGGLGKCSHSSALICDTPSQDSEETLAMCIGCGRYARAAGKEIRKIPGPKHSISAVSKVELYAGVAKRTRNTTIGQCGEWRLLTMNDDVMIQARAALAPVCQQFVALTSSVAGLTTSLPGEASISASLRHSVGR